MKEKVEKKVEVKSDIEARIEKLEGSVFAISRILGKVKSFLEKMFKFDIDGDGHIGKMALFLLLASIPVMASAEIGVESGDKFNVRVAAIRSNGDFDTEGGVVCAGNIVSAGSITQTGSSSQTVTNGQEITLSAGRNIITPSALANGYTNVVTVVNATDGYNYQIIVASTATNLLGLADGANLRLSAAFNGDANDSLDLQGYSTNYIERSRSAN